MAAVTEQGVMVAGQLHVHPMFQAATAALRQQQLLSTQLFYQELRIICYHLGHVFFDAL
jgi:hypothetical protein